MKNKIPKYSKVLAVATILPLTLSVGLSSQTSDVAFAATPEVKGASTMKATPIETQPVAVTQVQNQPQAKVVAMSSNTQVSATKITEQMRKPAAPTLNPLQPSAKTFTGKGIPGYTLTLLSRSNRFEMFRPIATTKVDTSGNWSITATDFFAEIGHEYQAGQEKDGVYSYLSNIVSPEPADTIAPEAPYVKAGVYDNTVRITGGSNENGDIIVTFPNGTKVTESAIANSWEVAVPRNVKLKAGDIIELQLVDLAGNRSPKTKITVLSSATAPELPTVNKIVTDQKTISGSATSGNTVKVTFENGQVVTTKAVAGNKWTVNVPNGLKLKVSNRVTVIQINQQGIKSGDTVKIVESGEVAAPTINPFVEGTKKISGTGIPGAEIMVYYEIELGMANKSSRAVIDENGKWTVDVDPTYMTVGRTISASQIYDTNLSAATIFNVAAAAKIPDPKPNLLQTYNSSTVSGSGMMGYTITVTFSNGKSLTTVVDKWGLWSIALPKGYVPKAGDKATIRQTSPSGAKSEIVRVYK